MTPRRPSPVHPAARACAADLAAGRLSRREFLSQATALGMTTAAACALAGLPAPARAQQAGPTGGMIRLQCDVRDHRDPRTYDWPQMAYVTHGTLEYLVEYNSDGSFHGMLLSHWDASDDAMEYVLHVRPGVTWSNGEPFTASDVARNIERWCDVSVQGNSMAARMASLIDLATGRAADGAIAVLDDATVRLRPTRSDITLIPGMADYPAAIVHADYDPDDALSALIGTGPMRVTTHLPGERAVLEKTEHPWWGYDALPGGGWHLDRLELVDLGTDPRSWVAAAAAGEVDVLYETIGGQVDEMDALGWKKSAIDSGSTVVVRANQQAEDGSGRRPYADMRVRRALTMAVDNAICLELGVHGRGIPAENCHVGPMHPEYDGSVTRLPYDPRQARAIMVQAGMSDYDHVLISVDDDLRRPTADAVAVQLRDAGLIVSRRILPRAMYWEGWTQFPFSTTDWNHRPLGTQVLSLAYRSGAAWNETGFADPAFDALLNEANGILSADARRVLMGRLQTILIEQGVVIQPFWRALFRHAAPHVIDADQHIAYLPRAYKWRVAG